MLTETVSQQNERDVSSTRELGDIYTQAPEKTNWYAATGGDQIKRECITQDFTLG